MTTTYVEASDDMKSTVLVAWNAACTAQFGATCKLFYQDRIKDGKLEVGNADEFWARVVVQHVTAGQTALGGRADGGRRHTAYGILYVQLFVPLAAKTAWRKAQFVASALKNALSGATASGTVWFTRPRVNDNIPPDPAHTRINVLCEFQYDEIV